MIVRYTKQQAEAIRAIRALGGQHYDALATITTLINEAIEMGYSDTITINMVVHDQVSSYLKSNGNLKVTDTKQGQPPLMTLIQSIDWK
jgi:hypothetical protein